MTLTGDTMSGVARDVAAGAAKKRRDRRYRSFWLHELMAVKMATLTACHHSAQKKLAAIHAAMQTDMTFGEQAPVYEYVAPARFTCPLAPVTEHTDDTDAAPAPMSEYVAPATPETVNAHVAPVPVIEYIVPPPTVSYPSFYPFVQSTQ